MLFTVCYKALIKSSPQDCLWLDHSQLQKSQNESMTVKYCLYYMKQQCNWYKNNSHERSGRAQFVSLLKSVSKEEPSHMACFRGNLFVWNTEFHMTSLNFKKWSESSHSRVRHRALLAVTLCVCVCWGSLACSSRGVSGSVRRSSC